jgi:GNAT superfamily N-acetyltransferase
MARASDSRHTDFLIRRASDADLPAIIDLFKVSLGEEGGIPQIQFWLWKHQQNPFGKSPTLVAYHHDKLVGLRTFLRWHFLYKGKVLQAYRAVDTATHPDYRGQGLFRKLTLQLIRELATEGPSFLFNTPNKQSKPGYIKMGWQELGRTNLYVKFMPFHWMTNRLGSHHWPTQSAPWSTEIEEAWNRVAPGYFLQFNELIVTNCSAAYLKWRYFSQSELNYHYQIENEGSATCMILYRLKASGRLKELRITDMFVDQSSLKLLSQCIEKASHAHRPDIITVLRDNKGAIKLPFGFIGVSKLGLDITYREINDPAMTLSVMNHKLLYFSSGALELF